MKQYFILAIISAIYITLFAGSAAFWHDKFQAPYNSGNYTGQASLVSSPKSKEDIITLLFAGDIMLDRGVEFYSTQHNDWKWPFRKIASTLQEADLAFGNLESVISDKGKNQGSIYSFRAEPEALGGLVFAGFDVLSVANNHSLDYGNDALQDSIQRLKDSGIVPIGGGNNRYETNAPTLKHFYTSKYDSTGTTIAMLAYTAAGSPLWQAGENSPGIAWVNESKIPEFQQDIKQAKQKADILVVSVHFGEEYQTQPSETQKLIAKSAIDAGADIVIGHHPHVVQLIEQYKNGWIAWSLGNFVFDQGFSKETMEGLLLEVKIERKQITQVIPRAIRMNASLQPELP
ncbi:MAG: CapA family protein [Candidatus Wildermuthbacteria bacterium]|nr:CapA family protein [Candidatus Wildermuthbacteria bacterium]